MNDTLVIIQGGLAFLSLILFFKFFLIESKIWEKRILAIISVLLIVIVLLGIWNVIDYIIKP